MYESLKLVLLRLPQAIIQKNEFQQIKNLETLENVFEMSIKPNSVENIANTINLET